MMTNKEPEKIVSFRVIQPVIAKTGSGRSSFMCVDGEHLLSAWAARHGIFYKLPGAKVTQMTPWANVIEVTYGD